MLQLDNTYKGEQMEITPEQEALNKRIEELAVIKELRNQDKEMLEDLEGLRVGQDSLKKEVQEGFAKGKDRMDGIEGELKEVKGDIKEISRQLIDFFAEAKRQHTEIKSEIQNGKIQELRNELQTRQKEDDKRNAFKSGLMIGLTVLAVGSILSLIGFLVSKVLLP